MNSGKNHNIQVSKQISNIAPRRMELEKRDLVHHKEINVHRQKPSGLVTNGNNFSVQINQNKIVQKKITTHLQL